MIIKALIEYEKKVARSLYDANIGKVQLEATMSLNLANGDLQQRLIDDETLISKFF